MTRAAVKTPARAVADIESGVVLATVDIAAPPERVLRALTTADEVLRWWGSDELYRITSWEADLRIDGRWLALGHDADGAPLSIRGEYLEIEPGRLTFSWDPDYDASPTTVVSVHLAATAAGTRVTVHHDGFEGHAASCEGHATGWTHILRWLDAHVAPSPPARFFVSRLIAPRPTFPADITPEERSLMGTHAAYWSQLLADGRAVLFGPVADPRGVWGLGVLRVANEAEARAIVDADPAIRADRGFGSELLPMIEGFVRG